MDGREVQSNILVNRKELFRYAFLKTRKAAQVRKQLKEHTLRIRLLGLHFGFHAVDVDVDQVQILAQGDHQVGKI